ncbi:hypothetical protein LZ24_01687 [Desulfobotulus alkaliphilus]|uniref:Uncharacterized protein n=1 Tax=Desulfobotulus alkaliphilus TaxID=622671 RepID=A0A562RT75_9BACT|nr:hypothetical protein [Desulfobotulus alkaliphilus]TWI72279.1 hypothetical protein LZ24_01687 [Desulfobotulus alkaliphilus]
MAKIPELDEIIAYMSTDKDYASQVDWNRRLNKIVSTLNPVATTGSSHAIGQALHNLNPLTMIASPFVGAYKAYKAGSLQETLWALTDAKYAKNYKLYKLGDYPCTCTAPIFKKIAMVPVANCSEVLTFICNQLNSRAARGAIAGTVVGSPFEMLYSAGRVIQKKIQGTSGQDRNRMSQALQNAARPEIEPVLRKLKTGGKKGCRQAQAIVAILLGELELDTPSQDINTFALTIGALASPKGWESIKPKMSSR